MWTSILLAQECLQLHPLPAWLYQWPDYQYVPPVWLSVRLQAQLCGERTWVANLCTRKGAGTGGANQGTGHSDTAAKDSAGRPQTSLDCEGITPRVPPRRHQLQLLFCDLIIAPWLIMRPGRQLGAGRGGRSAASGHGGALRAKPCGEGAGLPCSALRCSAPCGIPARPRHRAAPPPAPIYREIEIDLYI